MSDKKMNPWNITFNPNPGYESAQEFELELHSLCCSAEVEACLLGSSNSLSPDAQSMILEFVSLSSQEPTFDGCEVDILHYNEGSGHAVVKAKVWKKDCTRPIESIADSQCIERSQEADPLQQAILFAKARAMNEAFFVPFQTAEMEPETHRAFACCEDSCPCHEDPFPEYHDVHRVHGSDSTGEWPQIPQTAEYPPLSSPSYEALQHHPCHPSSFQYEGFVGVPLSGQLYCSEGSEDYLPDSDTLDQPSYNHNLPEEHPQLHPAGSNDTNTLSQAPYVLRDLSSPQNLSANSTSSCSFTRPLSQEEHPKEPDPSEEQTTRGRCKKKSGSS